jgi:hypothetical protein
MKPTPAGSPAPSASLRRETGRNLAQETEEASLMRGRRPKPTALKEVLNTASTSPCGFEATISRRSASGANTSPRSDRRTISTISSGRCERWPSVSFLTLPASR